MEETNHGPDRGNPIEPEAKWIRLQEIGIAQLVAIPFLPLLVFLCGIVAGTNLAIVLTVILVATGCSCISIGDEKRKQLRQLQRPEDSTE